MKDGWGGGNNSDWSDDGDTNQDGWGGGYPSKRPEPEDSNPSGSHLDLQIKYALDQLKGFNNSWHEMRTNLQVLYHTKYMKSGKCEHPFMFVNSVQHPAYPDYYRCDICGQLLRQKHDD